MYELDIYNKISNVLYFLKIYIINVGAFFVFTRLSGKSKFSIRYIGVALLIIVPTMIYVKIKNWTNVFDSMIIMILLMIGIFFQSSKNSLGYTIITTILSLCISNSIFFLSTFINSAPNIIFKIENDNIAFLFITILYAALLYCVFRNKKLRNGMQFLNQKPKDEWFDVLILNISVIILFSMEVFGNYPIVMFERMGSCIVILSIIMFLTIRKSFQVYYKQKLLFQQLAEANNEIQEKQKEIERLEEENLNFSKRSHSMAHKQKALEYKLNQLLMNEETTKEIGIAAEIKELSKELYQKPIEELAKTGIQKIDDMLKFMQSECIKNNIDINLQITGNVYHIINNIITVEQLEILIADHIKDAIIAIKHTDNVNKSILVKLGKIDECYGLYIYDSGIEFEKETLENLGKKPSTTHKDEGGTGMGFMNTFDTLRSCKGSLIIKEIGKPSKDNFTKIIMIKFDGQNEYKVISYR